MGKMKMNHTSNTHCRVTPKYVQKQKKLKNVLFMQPLTNLIKPNTLIFSSDFFFF